MNRPHASVLVPLLLVAAAAHAASGPNEPTAPAKANAAFLEPAMQALKSKRLVFVPDPHGNQDIAAALAAFYKDVEIPDGGGLTVMAEFINPVHQAMMDRYLLGLEDIPLAELSQAWYDTADIGTWRRDDPDVLRILSVARTGRPSSTWGSSTRATHASDRACPRSPPLPKRTPASVATSCTRRPGMQ